MPLSRAQVLARYRKVLRVFSRHGFGFLLDLSGLGFVKVWRRGYSPQHHRVSRGERLQRALEELGPAWIKLGQMLSTRADVLPPDMVEALEQLQDQVSTVPFALVQAVLEEELGELGSRFRSIDPEPVAAASLGQVHRAVLHDGRAVVIKVQRPRVEAQVELDLEVLHRLARLVARRTHLGAQYDLPGVAREFGAMLRSELDYWREAENAERMRANFAEDEFIRFPQVIWEGTTHRVLTLEEVGGLRITDRAALIAAGLDPREIAQRLAGALFKMVLRDGFFHADPHPGNLFVAPDGAIIFIDLGMVGELSPPMRENIIDYVVGVVSRDPDLVVEAILRMGVVGRPGVTSALRREVIRFQQKYGDVPIKQVELGPALRETMAMVRSLEIRFPTPYTVLLKSMITLEAVCRQVDPDATLVGLASPYAELVLQGRLQPRRLLSRLGRDLVETGRYSMRLPRQVSRVLAMMEEGEVKMLVEPSGLEPALRRVSLIANRLAIAILLASLIIGTALISSTVENSFLQRYPIADTGFVLIGAVGFWLVLSILGSRH